jgi:hypothetical protein
MPMKSTSVVRSGLSLLILLTAGVAGMPTNFGIANGLHKIYFEIRAAIMEILLCNSILMIFVAKKAPSTIIIATGKSNVSIIRR